MSQMYRFAGKPVLWEYYNDHYKLMLTYDYLQHMGYNPIYCDIEFPHPLRIRTTHGVEAYIAYQGLFASWRNGGSGTYVTEIRDWLNVNNIMQGEFATKIVPDIVVNAKIVGGELNWDPANIPIEDEPIEDEPIEEQEVEVLTQAEIIERAKLLSHQQQQKVAGAKLAQAGQPLPPQPPSQKPIVEQPIMTAGANSGGTATKTLMVLLLVGAGLYIYTRKFVK